MCSSRHSCHTQGPRPPHTKKNDDLGSRGTPSLRLSQFCDHRRLDRPARAHPMGRPEASLSHPTGRPDDQPVPLLARGRPERRGSEDQPGKIKNTKTANPNSNTMKLFVEGPLAPQAATFRQRDATEKQAPGTSHQPWHTAASPLPRLPPKPPCELPHRRLPRQGGQPDPSLAVAAQANPLVAS